MAVLFVLHGKLHWERWFVAAIGLTAIVFLAHHIELDEFFFKAELSLLMFFISLCMLVGGVEESQFLEYLGQFMLPFVRADLLTACIVLMWGSAVFSSAIDNIPFTAAMIPIILGMETQGINVTPLWCALAVGVGIGNRSASLLRSSLVEVASTRSAVFITKDQSAPTKSGALGNAGGLRWIGPFFIGSQSTLRRWSPNSISPCALMHARNKISGLR